MLSEGLWNPPAKIFARLMTQLGFVLDVGEICLKLGNGRQHRRNVSGKYCRHYQPECSYWQQSQTVEEGPKRAGVAVDLSFDEPQYQIGRQRCRHACREGPPSNVIERDFCGPDF